MKLFSFILSFWLTFFAALPTFYGTACLQSESSIQTCCIDASDKDRESKNCCDENSNGTCAYCNSVYLAVLTTSKEKNIDFVFTDKVCYPKMDNSFLSTYLNVPFHPPKNA